MPTTDKLTEALAKRHEPPIDGKPYVIVYDGEVKGFGLRVTKAGARSFVVNYRARGVERRLTIGSFPDWSVAAAREEAKRLKREIDRGRDPMVERHEERAAPTVSDLAARYLEEHAAGKRPGSRREDEGIIRQWVLPELGSRKVPDVRLVDIEKLHRKITKTGTPYRANRVIALLSTMFGKAVKWELRTDNPVRGIERNTEQKRARYLKPDELQRLTTTLAAHPNQEGANIIRLLLLTGARRAEVLGLRWDQLDLDAGVWTKPASLTKQNAEHRIPLSAPALQILAGIRAEAERGDEIAATSEGEAVREKSPKRASAKRRAAIRARSRKSSAYVFIGRDGKEVPIITCRRVWVDICKRAGLEGVRLHDLRHSYASILASAGLSLPIIGQLLGHSMPSTTARYAHLMDDPLRAATERVGAIVSGRGLPAEIVSIERARGR
jgi:integrase